MSSYIYDTTRVCPKQIRFDLEDGTLHNVVFLGGGCDGNLHALPKLLEGASAQQTVDILKGNLCGPRGTSCADQLARAVEAALAEEGAAPEEA